MSARFSRGKTWLCGAVFVTAVTLAFAAGSRFGKQRGEEQLLAVAWGDGKYGPGFYGAYVFLEPALTGYRVRARVAIGRGNGMFHDCGEIGQSPSHEDAVARFGTIEWSAAGLGIGPGPPRYFLPRTELERHR